MGRRKGIMSDALKYEFAKELGIMPSIKPLTGDNDFETASELGIYNTGQSTEQSTEQSIDWGSVSSKNCGNLVKIAIERANRTLE